MFYKVFVTLLIAAGVLLLLWMVRGVLLTPVRLGKNQRLSLVLTVTGRSPELENTVDALAWLMANGTLKADIVVRDAGMDEETAATAAVLERSGVIKMIH